MPAGSKQRPISQAQRDQGMAFRLLRVVKGISQAELAEAVGRGTSTSSVSDWEKGKVAPREDSVDRLLLGMGLPREALDRALAFIGEIRLLTDAYSTRAPGSEVAEPQSAFSALLATNPAFKAQVEHLTAIARRSAPGLTLSFLEAICTFLESLHGGPGAPEQG